MIANDRLFITEYFVDFAFLHKKYEKNNCTFLVNADNN